MWNFLNHFTEQTVDDFQVGNFIILHLTFYVQKRTIQVTHEFIKYCTRETFKSFFACKRIFELCLHSCCEVDLTCFKNHCHETIILNLLHYDHLNLTSKDNIRLKNMNY